MTKPLPGPDGARWRCFGGWSPLSRSCGAPARWKAPAPAIADARAFYCDRCRPATAQPIEDFDAFHLRELAIIVSFPAATLDRAAGRDEALARLVEAVAALGGSFQLVRGSGRIMARQPGVLGSV